MPIDLPASSVNAHGGAPVCCGIVNCFALELDPESVPSFSESLELPHPASTSTVVVAQSPARMRL
ncbi:MAG: hypothetical protein QM714_04785 [Nocardioides sp.]|uniref:hypothetical protein n=1 Tax=Nocardioides sp. TaxID=35761 RepID=UPI0039E343C3